MNNNIEHYFVVVHETDDMGNRRWRLESNVTPPVGKPIFDNNKGEWRAVDMPNEYGRDSFLYEELSDALDNINNNLF